MANKSIVKARSLPRAEAAATVSLARCCAFVMRLRSAAALFAALLPASSAPAQSQPVAQLVRVHGRVTVNRARGPVRSFYQLLLGDTIDVKNGATTVVFYGSGQQFRLSPGAEARVQREKLLRLKGDPPVTLPPMPTALRIGPERQTNGPSARLMGELERCPVDSDLGPREPLPVGAVRPGSVTLTWKGPLSDGSAEPQPRLELWVGEAESHRTVLSQELDGASRSFTLPEHRLNPGVWYVWTVTTLGGPNNGRRCRSIVRILTKPEVKRLSDIDSATEQARAQHARNSAAPLIAAEIYEQLGLVTDALVVYKEQAVEDPEDQGLELAIKRLQTDIMR